MLQGVTVYVIVPDAPVVLIKISDISADDGTVLAVPPVTPSEVTGAGHVNVIPSAGFVKLSKSILQVNDCPEHIAGACSEMTGSGLTVTTTS